MISILDFGSQYTQLIARRVRELGVYSEIFPYNVALSKVAEHKPDGMILSGSPASVGGSSPALGMEFFELGLPVLGICYGMQFMAALFGGAVTPGAARGYGKSTLKITRESRLFKGIPKEFVCWMSHGDHVSMLPKGFISTAAAADAPVAAMEKGNLFAIQFHPEVVHTNYGECILSNFVKGICGAKADWKLSGLAGIIVENIKAKVKDKNVLCGLSGGVDSAVAAALISRAIGERLTCVFVDTGLMRLNEGALVEETFSGQFNARFVKVNAEERFLNALKGVVDPERKRKIIGELFIRVFEEESKKLGKFDYLAQGTLYPDVIESVSVKGPSVTIKSHHNVGGLPERMDFELLEPLRELFKDEVRKVGDELGLAKEIVYRHPFPGPGLAVRILGEVTKERCDILRVADNIAMEELHKSGDYDKVWQAFCVLLPINSVGVAGDERTYENVAAFRAVTAVDGMTADWAKLDYELLNRISNRVINEVKGINRMVYDISSKPPATIEWE